MITYTEWNINILGEYTAREGLYNIPEIEVEISYQYWAYTNHWHFVDKHDSTWQCQHDEFVIWRYGQDCRVSSKRVVNQRKKQRIRFGMILFQNGRWYRLICSPVISYLT
jgi:hypothetical protein